MRCERCQKNTARLTVTLKTKDGSKMSHLCPMCALTLPTFYTPHAKAVRPDVSCPVCQMSLSEFRQSGRLGCSNCYDVFQLDLTDVLNRVQGTANHVRPVATSQNDVQANDALTPLRQALKDAVDAEDYYLAATIRDEIKEKTRRNGHNDG